MTEKFAINDFAALGRRADEISAETAQRIMGTPIEDAKPVEAPEDIDWSGVYGIYGSPAGFNSAARIAYTSWGEPYNASYLAKA